MQILGRAAAKPEFRLLGPNLYGLAAWLISVGDAAPLDLIASYCRLALRGPLEPASIPKVAQVRVH
jgi:hypothetical protein